MSTTGRFLPAYRHKDCRLFIGPNKQLIFTVNESKTCNNSAEMLSQNLSGTRQILQPNVT